MITNSTSGCFTVNNERKESGACRSASAAAPESGAGRHDAAETFVSAEGGDALRTARSVSGEIERDARRYDGGFYLY